MSITWANVTAFASELSTVAVEAQDVIVAYVNAALLEDVFGAAQLVLAQTTLAAHFGTLVKRKLGASGTVASESMGGISRSYATAAIAGGRLDSTSYGSLHQLLLDTSGARLPMVIGCRY